MPPRRLIVWIACTACALAAAHGAAGRPVTGRPVTAPALANADSRGAGDLVLNGLVFGRVGSVQPPLPVSLTQPSRADGRRLWVVQFGGPIRKEWHASLRAADLDIVSYIAPFAYVVWGEAAALALTTDALPLVKSGEYLPAYRLAPSLRGRLADGTPRQPTGHDPRPSLDVMVQRYRGSDDAAERAALESLVSSQGGTGLEIGVSTRQFVSRAYRVPLDAVIEIARLPSVYSVREWRSPALHDERQGQILAGAVISSVGRAIPAGPGYLAFLAARGFSQSPGTYPIVAITDDGVDSGDPSSIAHPDLHDRGDLSQPSRVAFSLNCTLDAAANDVGGHGTLNAGIIAGYNGSAGLPFQDGDGYALGLGIAPHGRVGNVKLFADSGVFDLSRCGQTLEQLVREAYGLGATISSNSWGTDAGGAYDEFAQAFDALTRDADDDPSNGWQEYLHVFSAGNAGPDSTSIGSPATAKNVIAVGATENVREHGLADGCGVSAAGNAGSIADFSSRGPTADGRAKPDLVAPGTHIQGPATQQPGFNGASVCGGPGRAPFHPPQQTLYTWSSGTSHAAPAIAGVAALTSAYYSNRIQFGARPSPAMIKALLTNAPRVIGGTSAIDVAFGWGMPDLSRAFDGVARRVVDQQHVFTESGQVFETGGRIGDAARPFRVTLAWTDAPGSVVGPAYVNDLDLELTVGGATYLGNAFGAEGSVTGGDHDVRNNVESVFLPAGASGDYRVRVVARNIAGDGLPGNQVPLDQDFALVIYNPEAGYVSGDVHDVGTSGGIVGARIVASAGPTATFLAQAGAGGQWSMALPTGAYTFTATAYGYAPIGHPPLALGPGSHHTLSFGLSPVPSASVSGVVTDAVTGLPVIGVVKVRGEFADPPDSIRPTDDATGSYHVRLATGQAYTVAFESLLHTPAQVRLDALITDTVVNAALMPTTHFGGLIGAVTDATDGLHVAGARIGLEPSGASATTTADGRFVVLSLNPGTYTVTAHAPPRSAFAASVGIAQSRLTRLDLALPSGHARWTTRYVTRALEFGATATDAWQVGNDGTAPLQYRVAAGTLPPAWLAVSPSAGVITPGEVLSLSLGWDAAAAGQPGIYTGTLSLAFDDPRTPRLDVSARLQVDPSPDLGRVRGRVFSLGECDADDRPAPGARLDALGPGGLRPVITPTFDGAFSHYLTPGTYILAANAAGHVSQTAQLTILTGAVARLDFGLRLDAPCLRMTPAAISEVVTLGATVSIPITLDNRGTRALEVRTFESHESPESAIVDRGGPDAFGYTYRTSVDSAGPAFKWIPPGDGAKLRLSDDSTAQVALPFEFPFYDLRVSRIGVNNNGAILVQDANGELDWVNRPLSSTATPAYLIAPFWDDLDGVFGSVHATAFTATQPARFVISWMNRPHFDLEGLATFQAVLFSDGAILFQYADTDFGVPAWDDGASATIGIKGRDASQVLESSFMSPSAPAGTAVCFRRPQASDCGESPVEWLSSTASISVEAGSAAVITLSLNSAALAQPGPAAARLNLLNNSPTALVGLPVRVLAPVPDDFGHLTVVAWSARGCGDGREPLTGAVLRSDTWPHELGAGPAGTFNVWLPVGRQAVAVSHAGHESVTRTVVVSRATATAIDTTLRALEPCGQVEPSSGITIALTPGGIATREIAIANTGPAAMDWRIQHDTAAVGPSQPIDLIRDGGFESTPLTFEGGEWGADSFRFGTPLCTTLPPFYCGVGSGTAGPRSGAWFAWLFGSSRGDFGSISQTVFISYGTASLVFHAWVGVPGGAGDSLQVLMDQAVVGQVPITAATAGYRTFEIDVSDFANDRPHTLSFAYSIGPRSRISIDDVALWLTEPHRCTDSPAWLGVAPDVGSLAGDAALVARAVLHAGDASSGEHVSTLCVVTDDPRKSRHFVPVRLQVVPAHLVFVPVLARP